MSQCCVCMGDFVCVCLCVCVCCVCVCVCVGCGCLCVECLGVDVFIVSLGVGMSGLCWML